MRRRSNATNTGKGTESLIQTICDEYERQGIALIKKVDPPVRIAGKRIIFLANPFLDYTGCVKGRRIDFEAKSTQKHRLPINRPKGGVTEKQFTNLRKWHRAGSIVFVLWEHQNELRLLTIEDLAGVVARGEKSIIWDAAKQIKKGNGFLIYDFLKEIL